MRVTVLNTPVMGPTYAALLPKDERKLCSDSRIPRALGTVKVSRVVSLDKFCDSAPHGQLGSKHLSGLPWFGQNQSI